MSESYRMRCPLLGVVFSAIVLLSRTAYSQSEFVYLNNGIAAANSVSAFSLSSDGTLSEIPGSPFLTGAWGFRDSPILVVGKFLYVGNSNSLSISAFSINPITGSLTPVANSPFPLEGVSYGTIMTLASTPDGRFLMASNIVPGTITIFRIGTDGSLAPTANPPFLIGEAISDMKVSPNGRFLAAALSSRNWIVMLSIAADGTLSVIPASPFSNKRAFSFANSVEFNCDGTILFVGSATLGPPQIDEYAVRDDGSLSPVQGSPFAAPDAMDSAQVLFSQNNQYLFVTNFESNKITVFKASSGNTLSPVENTPFKVKDDYPGALALNRAGTILLSGNFGRNQYRKSISIFAVSRDGELSHAPGSPFYMGDFSYLNNSVSIAMYPARDCTLRIDRVTKSGKKLFVTGANFDNGSVILLNGEEQRTINDDLDWTSLLIAKKAGKKVKFGDKISVRTSNGRLSSEFIVTDVSMNTIH